MSETNTVYDPTLLQIENLNSLNLENLSIEELSKPEVVTMLLERQRITLIELKSSNDKNNNLTNQVEKLREEKSDLKVELAESKQRQSILWLEIPVSILSGFAINMLTAKPTDGVAWAILILTIIVLLSLRLFSRSKDKS